MKTIRWRIGMWFLGYRVNPPNSVFMLVTTRPLTFEEKSELSAYAGRFK